MPDFESFLADLDEGGPDGSAAPDTDAAPADSAEGGEPSDDGSAEAPAALSVDYSQAVEVGPDGKVRIKWHLLPDDAELVDRDGEEEKVKGTKRDAMVFRERYDRKMTEIDRQIKDEKGRNIRELWDGLQWRVQNDLPGLLRDLARTNQDIYGRLSPHLDATAIQTGYDGNAVRAKHLEEQLQREQQQRKSAELQALEQRARAELEQTVAGTRLTDEQWHAVQTHFRRGVVLAQHMGDPMPTLASAYEAASSAWRSAAPKPQTPPAPPVRPSGPGGGKPKTALEIIEELRNS